MRTLFLLLALFSLTIPGTLVSTVTVAQAVSSTLLPQRIQMACSFLKSLYNPSLGLVGTTPSSNVYYVASDNLLAEKVLSSCDPAIGKAINQSISSCCGTGYDLMHEALLGKRIPLPIHVPTINTVDNSSQGNLFNGVTPASAGGNYTVLWEKHNGTGIFLDCTYADVTVYTTLELKLEGNSTGVQHEMDCLALMFDGRGLVDEAYKDGSEHGIYQTYKLALYLYALTITGAYYYGKEENLFRLQGPDGGFHTGYDQAGTYAGTLENAETTSIVMIALSNTSPPCIFRFLSIPPWIIYHYGGLVAAAIGVVVMTLVPDQRSGDSDSARS